MADAILISISDVAVTLSLGVTEGERRRPQEVLISATIGLRETAPFRSDDIHDTIDYADLIAYLQEEMPALPSLRLIESVAERVAARVLEHPLAGWVEVRVRKPSVLPAPAFAAVSVRREKRA